MRFDPGARTALAFVTLRADGEREFMFYRNPSADMLLTESELDLDIITKDFNGRVHGLKVDVVDTTGAGDAFVAGILSQLAADISLLQDETRLREALRFANACERLDRDGKGCDSSLAIERGCA
ncbi:hypothetical protein Scep_022947 [Stephania cephalantha]|uniref:Carbohydrate kinase PfkB domain-containing protein n=1 Tax=Stephania cephalantha TaxID=152367 RepID=A0AAP0FHN4_9MAGN